MDCENSSHNIQISVNNTNVCSKLNKNFCSKSISDNLIKQNSEIVFNNQTNKLLKQVLNCDSTTPVMGKYNLRKKSVQNRLDSIKKQQIDKLHMRGLVDDTKPKKRKSQLSKHNRKNANARERSRVQALNDAFEKLRSKLQSNFIQQKSADKTMTKIETLRNANTYIASLQRLLSQSDTEIGETDNKLVDSMTNNIEEQQQQNNKLNSNVLDDLNSIKLKSDDKQQDQKMDALPDISFIDELSSLSFMSNEENQLPNEKFDLLSANAVQNEIAISNKLNDSLHKCCLDQSSFNSNQINQFNNNATFVSNAFQNNNSTYSVHSSVLNNLNVDHQQSVQINNNTTKYLPTLNCSDSSSNNNLQNLAIQDNNQSYRIKNGSFISTPLQVHRIIDHQLSSSISPIKYDGYQATNYLSAKSVGSIDDDLLNCYLDGIENSSANFLSSATLTKGDDFDLIL